ncbi:threonine aldolase [bacterium]|nr:threonine aldolase [bacterium]
MNSVTRRDFLRVSGLTAAAGLGPGLSSASVCRTPGRDVPVRNDSVQFVSDGLFLPEEEYAGLLLSLSRSGKPLMDRYGSGGAVRDLLEAFKECTGTEAAVFMPSGTMANQLAISVLAGRDEKVIVQEQSHVFRDEADAAQTVFGKRLIPLAKGKAALTLDEIQEATAYIRRSEVFPTGIGVISIENTVRRQYEEIVDFKEMAAIADWARRGSIRMHLDGARIFMASAYTGISVQQYAALFDTVYISLYKYLGAGAGAVLCGRADVIRRMDHLVKVHGGSMFRNWHNAAVALHFLDGFQTRFARARDKAAGLFALLSALDGLRVEAFPRGSNVFKLYIEKGDRQRFRQHLAREYSIELRAPAAEEDFIPLKVNESLLRVANEEIVAAFSAAARSAR